MTDPIDVSELTRQVKNLTEKNSSLEQKIAQLTNVNQGLRHQLDLITTQFAFYVKYNKLPPADVENLYR